MDSGWAVIIGGTVGVFGTWGTTWLNHYFAQSKKNKSEESAKKLLLSLLNGKWRWRNIQVMANVVGTDEETVRRLLLEIGARGSMREPRLWGLVSRNPIGEADLPADDPIINSSQAPRSN
jgi:hypothetical protein